MKKSYENTYIIKPNSNWMDFQFYEIWRYRDLLVMFVNRDFISVYKQTILGPLWFIIQPLLTTVMFIVVFDRVAGIPTDGAPPALFYLSGLVIWNYFSTCLMKTSSTFINNAGIFGKVYFPRLIVPLSTVISALISLCIQLGLLFLLVVYFYLFYDSKIELNYYLVFLPLIMALTAGLGLGMGIIISALTTKYRDLMFLITFGVQLLMYATPIIYPMSFFTGNYRILILANPLTPIIEIFRFSILGVGDFNSFHIVYSFIFTFASLFVGILLFNKVEKDFMDVV